MRQNFRQLMALRQKLFHHGLQQLSDNGWMKPEPVSGQYQHLTTQLLLMGNHWITESAIQFEQEEEEVVRYYHRAMMALLFPYLSKKGKQVYGELTAAGLPTVELPGL